MNKNLPRISLRAARVNAGLTQKNASKSLNINIRTLQKYESGEVIPQWDTVLGMSALYGIDVDFLYLSRKTANCGNSA